MGRWNRRAYGNSTEQLESIGDLTEKPPPQRIGASGGSMLYVFMEKA